MNIINIPPHQPGANFVVVDTLMYFLADDGANGIELWATNGTQNGTYLVDDIVKWNTPPITASIKATETDSFGVQKSKSVTVQKPVSIEKYNDNGFELFPNPSNGIIHLNVSERIAKNATFSFYNSLGQLIDKGIQLQNGNTFDLSYLPKGMFTLSVISNSEFRSKKFVLQ